MLNRKFRNLVILLFIAMPFTATFAQEKAQEVGPGVKVLMYIPERVADLFDIFNVGIAFGPAIGAEVAITKYAQFGAYSADEVGFAWTGRGNPKLHKGLYQTTVFGADRTEPDVENTHYFHRGDYQVRAQVAPFLAHVYVGIDLKEIGDFIAGIFTLDPSNDDYKGYGVNQLDKDYDTILGTSPLHRLGRGLSNVIFGFWEIPQNAMDVTKDQGPAAGFTYGLIARGLSRFVVRELTGVWEIITFAKGGKEIIQPEYPWMDHEEHNWNFEWN
jgi:putative exosortase-associated protein (TIGR04073 family)